MLFYTWKICQTEFPQNSPYLLVFTCYKIFRRNKGITFASTSVEFEKREKDLVSHIKLTSCLQHIFLLCVL